jgi:hypothetical protein
MKYSRSHVHRKLHKLPTLRFEAQTLTSFAGLVLVQALFSQLRLKERLATCFAHLPGAPIFGPHVVVLVLVAHLLLGYRELRDQRYYRDDPLVKRLLGLTRLPDVATVSRALAAADPRSVDRLRDLGRRLVVDRLQTIAPPRLTLDFDGTVLHTKRRAEGSAVGYCKPKKGARSYYPLFCTIAQTGQVFDVHHRSGNVHDSNGAAAFVVTCLERVRQALPGVTLEVRLDSAFFSETIVATLEAAHVEYSISVPFERFTALKALVEARRRWRRLSPTLAYFEPPWAPECWTRDVRVLVIRERVPERTPGPVQLDLFTPQVWGYKFKAIITNKRVGSATVLAFHNGRGAQEGLFAQLKTQTQLDYIPVRRLVGNQLFLHAVVLTHNLGRELQMVCRPATRRTEPTRPALWDFQELQTVRQTLLRRAGRLTQPHGELTLTISANADVRDEILAHLRALTKAA